MNKIYTYLLGVFIWLSTVAAKASEKFEILPELPDPLGYAVQPAAASTISGVTDTSGLIGTQSIGHEPNIISVVLSLAFVVLLIYVTGILYTKLNRAGFKAIRNQQGDIAKSQVAVLSTTQLGGTKTLHVVELDGKRMLIGASTNTIQLIKDLGTVSTEGFNEEYSHIEIPNIKIPKIEIPKIEIPTINFSKLVTKAHKGLKDIETITNNIDIKESTEEIQEQLNSKESNEIIETLFTQQNLEEEITTPAEEEDSTISSHVVDPDDFALYKKYLG